MKTEAEYNICMEQLARREFPKVLAIMEPAKRGTVPLSLAVIKFYSKIDNLLEKVEQRLACETGCSYCCHYHVYVYASETFTLVDAMKRLPKTTQEVILQSICRNLETIKPLTVDEHIATNIPCAFLIDGKCSVYAARPTACRHHQSADGVSCKITFDNPASKMLNQRSPEHAAVTTAMITAFETAQRSVGMDVHRYELHSAVLEALENPATLKRWRTGKTAFPNVKDRA